MKVKIDFVTNSSTTSFVVWGVSLDHSEVLKNEKLLELAFTEYEKEGYNKTGLTFNEFEEEQKNGSFWEFMELIGPVVEPLEVSTGPDGDDFWIGAPVEKQRDSQTLGEYKKEIISKLNQLGINVDRVNYICEAWRDG